MKADADGFTPVAIVNHRLGVGFAVVARKAEFPCMFEWQNLQAGQYALGIEPATNHVLGAKFARDRGELIRLDHGEFRQYRTVFKVLDGRGEIQLMEKGIEAITPTVIEEYPDLTYTYHRLR